MSALTRHCRNMHDVYLAQVFMLVYGLPQSVLGKTTAILRRPAENTADNICVPFGHVRSLVDTFEALIMEASASTNAMPNMMSMLSEQEIECCRSSLFAFGPAISSFTGF